MIAVDSTIPSAVVQENVARLREQMRANSMVAVIVFHPSNMLAFTGTPHASWDRLTCAAITGDGVHVVCPAFERPAAAGAESLATIHTWNEEQDAYQLVADTLAENGAKRGKVGVDGRMWLETWLRFRELIGARRVDTAEPLLREVRLCKSAAAQKLMHNGHARGERLFLRLTELIQPGISEAALASKVRHELAADGIHVDPMIQSGPNGAIPHNPTGDRELQEGDNVVVDSVVLTDGFNNDLTRTYAVGTPSDRAKQAYRAVREAQRAAIGAARPGVPCEELDNIARAIIEDAGFGEFFTHRLGHGIGIECHEPPYLVGGNTEQLRPGMCVTIEPGVYVPGEFGVRIEDDVVITDDGCKVIAGELHTDVTTAFD